jgi:hypothetical protein
MRTAWRTIRDGQRSVKSHRIVRRKHDLQDATLVDGEGARTTVGLCENPVRRDIAKPVMLIGSRRLTRVTFVGALLVATSRPGKVKLLGEKGDRIDLADASQTNRLFGTGGCH